MCVCALPWAAPLDGQMLSRLLGEPVAWQVHFEGPAYVVSGLTLDADGAPRGNVLVSIEGTDLGTVTDPEGRFELSVPGAGDWVIVLRALGFTPIQHTMTVPQGANVRILALLHRSGGGVCALRICRTNCKDLEIEVLNAETGERIDTDVTVRLEHETGAWSHTQGLDPSFPVFGLQRDIETQGFHDIEVSAPGYHPWRIEGAWMELTNECHPRLVGRRHVVHLVPVEPG